MKKLVFTIASLICLSSLANAGDIYRINNRDTLVTARHNDLEVIMQLNQRHLRAAVRNMYDQLLMSAGLFNLQPGATVDVTQYFNDGTAEIQWNNGQFRGFINKDDLTTYLGPSQSPVNQWVNPVPAQRVMPPPAVVPEPVVPVAPTTTTTTTVTTTTQQPRWQE
jgi:hypothetical protein